MKGSKPGNPARRYGGRLRGGVSAHIRRTMFRGILLLVPVALTYLIFRFLYGLVSGLLEPALGFASRTWGIDLRIPGLAFAIAVLLVYFAGFFLANSIGRRMVHWGQTAVLRTPLVGQVYSATRKLVESFSGTQETGFKRVVMVHYPWSGAWSIGFLTAITTTSDGKRLAVVFVPQAPLPSSGAVAIFPYEEVLDTDLSVPVAMQMIFSGGIVSPGIIKTTRLQATASEDTAEVAKKPSVIVP